MLQLRFLKKHWIRICMYLVQQFWWWIYGINKACYQETQKRKLYGNKQELFGFVNKFLQNIVNFQGKHPHGNAFFTKLQVAWHFQGNFSWEIYKIFTNAFIKKTHEWGLLQLVVTEKCFNQKILFKRIT